MCTTSFDYESPWRSNWMKTPTESQAGGRPAAFAIDQSGLKPPRKNHLKRMEFAHFNLQSGFGHFLQQKHQKRQCIPRVPNRTRYQLRVSTANPDRTQSTDTLLHPSASSPGQSIFPGENQGLKCIPALGFSFPPPVHK